MVDHQALGKRRLRLLIKQLMLETDGNQSEVARRIGCEPGMVNHIINGRREGGDKLIPRSMDSLALDSRFFYDESLGTSPNYKDHIARAQSSVDREDTKPPYPAWDGFLQHAWTVLLTGELREWTLPHLQGVRWKDGEPSVEDYLDLARNRVARFKGKAAPDGPPIAPPREAGNTRKLPPAKRRK